MTVGEAMERAEELRPGSRVAARTRQRWLCEVDGMLCAMTDAALGENDRYAGEQAQYNSILAELAAWLRRKNLPTRGCSWRW